MIRHLGPRAARRIRDKLAEKRFGLSMTERELKEHAAACAQLVEAAGGSLCGFGFVAELAALDGRSRLPQEHPVESLIIYS